jgi:hypothetical protein
MTNRLITHLRRVELAVPDFDRQRSSVAHCDACAETVGEEQR